MHLVHCRLIVRPTWMVPDDISTLLQCYINRLERILDIETVGILDENRIQVTKWFSSGDFSTLDKDESEIVRLFLRDLI